MSLVADYGSDSDSEPEINKNETKNEPAPMQPPAKKAGIFAKLPPPKSKDDSLEEKGSKAGETEVKKKVHTFTVPINTETLKRRKEDIEQPDEGERPKKKAAPSSTLPFLPAPKHADLYDEAKKVNSEVKKNVPKSASTKRVPLSFKQNPQLASLLQDEERSVPVEEDTQPQIPNIQEEEEVAADTPVAQDYNQADQQTPGLSAEQYHQLQYQQQYQDYYNQQQYYNPDGQIYYQQGQQQQQYFNKPVAGFKDPLLNAPREFRELRGLGANIVEIKQDERKKDFPKYRSPDYFEEQMSKTRNTATVMPDRSQKRQGHISYLLHEMHMKEADLALKKAEGNKNRRETRMKYGW